MKELSTPQQAVELLQQLGLKEYEARCFVALSRLPKATAKEISETSDVPRTRVYDAIRVLESKGLVEIQHTNPQLFRAVPVAEAGKTLKQEYHSRTNTLVETLNTIDPAPTAAGREVTHEVWSLSGTEAITNRTHQLIDEAESEIIFIITREEALTDELLTSLQTANGQGLTVIVGTITEALKSRLETALPNVSVFVTELEWLHSSPVDPSDDTAISRMLLIDRGTILVSSVEESTERALGDERAIFGQGFTNGIVVIARRLMATGLPPEVEIEAIND